MKRTELKRTGRIKPKSKRNGDTAESLSLRRAYREANPGCEVELFLRLERIVAQRNDDDAMLNGLHAWMATLPFGTWSRGVQLDHIAGGSGGRLDLWSMMIVVNAAWHELKTANTPGLMLLFLIVKANKKTPEIDAAEFKQCSGYDLAGWLSLDKTIESCPAWLEPFRVKLLESLR